jgi:hypothetical protein
MQHALPKHVVRAGKIRENLVKHACTPLQMNNVVLITTDGCIGACACCREMLRLNGLTSYAPFPCVATAESCPTCITTVDSPPDNDTNTHGHPQPQEHPPHSTTARAAPIGAGPQVHACLLPYNHASHAAATDLGPC